MRLKNNEIQIVNQNNKLPAQLVELCGPGNRNTKLQTDSD